MPQNSVKSITQEQIAREFKFVIDLMPQMVWSTRPDGYHDFYNQRWYDFTGLSFEETKDKGWSLVLHPDDYEISWEVWKYSLETGNPYEIEYRMRKFDGTYNWFLARAEPLKDDRGKILKWFGTCTDIQEQREILEELKRTKEELHISNKDLSNSIDELSRINLELDNFVYSASHDLKAPLNNLEGLVTLLEPSEDGETNENEILHLIDKSVKRFKEVVNDMTFIAPTKDSHKMQNINISLLIGEIKSDLRYIINSTESVIKLELEEMNFRYPRNEIRSILFNLISNGIKYKHPQRTPVISVRAKLIEKEILIEVDDNGIGINAEYIPELFDKYFRINPHLEGSGLGLFIVKRMVENRGGRIEVRSRVGKGSRFSVFLNAEE